MKTPQEQIKEEILNGSITTSDVLEADNQQLYYGYGVEQTDKRCRMLSKAVKQAVEGKDNKILDAWLRFATEGDVAILHFKNAKLID